MSTNSTPRPDGNQPHRKRLSPSERERQASAAFESFLAELRRGHVDHARRHLSAINTFGFGVDQPVDSGSFRLVQNGGGR
jgi:hypothetical protein